MQAGSWEGAHARLMRGLDGYAVDVLETTGTPGLTVAVANRGGVVLARGYGVLDLASGEPMPAGALFPIGSIGKMLVGAAVMREVEVKRLDLDVEAMWYMGTALVNPLAPQQRVTLRQLLTHGSGLRSEAHHVSLAEPGSVEDYVASRYAARSGHEYGGVGALWTAPPERRYQYSNVGVETAALAVSSVSGLPYAQYVEEEICGPIGMTSTFVGLGGRNAADIRARMATGYERMGGMHLPTPWLHSPLPASTGVITSAPDLALYLAMMLNRGEAPGGRRVLRPESVDAIVAPARTGSFAPGDPPVTVGLGVQVGGEGRYVRFGHFGAHVYGWWGQALAYPELGLAVAVLTNSWDMVRYVTPMNRSAPGLMCDYVARVVDGDELPRRGERESREWRESYAYGLLHYDRIWGVLGVREPVTHGQVDAMVAGARSLAGATHAEGWDPDGFRAGVFAMAASGGSPEAMRAFLGSRECAVTPAELRLVALRLGASRAEWPSPMAFYAEREEERAAG